MRVNGLEWIRNTDWFLLQLGVIYKRGLKHDKWNDKTNVGHKLYKSLAIDYRTTTLDIVLII